MHTQHRMTTIQRAICFACVLLCVLVEAHAVYAKSPPPPRPIPVPIPVPTPVPSPPPPIPYPSPGGSIDLTFLKDDGNLGILVPPDIYPDGQPPPTIDVAPEPPPAGMYYVNDELQPGGTDFVQVAATDAGCLALKDNGQIVGWDAYGWLEDIGPSDLSSLKGPFVNRGFTQINSTGDTICGIRRTGATCWGDDWYLGAAGLENWQVQTIAAADGGACALAANGAMVCISDEWDDKWPKHGQFTALDCGLGSCCAVRDNGRVFCWGDLDANPRVDGLIGGFSQVSVDYETACGVRLDGHVTCWSEPELQMWAPALDGFTQVSVRDIACGVSGGQLVCWRPIAAPAPVTVLAQHVVQVELAISHLCARYVDGSVMMHPIPSHLRFNEEPLLIPPPLQWIPDSDKDHTEELSDEARAKMQDNRVLQALLTESPHDQLPPLWIDLGDAAPSDLMAKNKGLSEPQASYPWVSVGGAPTAWALQEKLNSLTARDLTTGKQRWQRPRPPSGIICANEVAGVVMVVFSNESVQTFDAKTGAPRWTLAEDFNHAGLCEAQAFPGSPGFIVLAHDPESDAEMPSLALLNPTTGQTVWRSPDPFHTALPPRPYFAQTDALGSVAWFGESHSESALIALDPAKGAHMWRWSAPSGQILRGFAMSGERVWVITTEATASEELPTRGILRHHLTALRRADGLPDSGVRPSVFYSAPLNASSEVWTRPNDVEPKIWARPDALVVMTEEGIVRVIDPASGVMRWSWGLDRGFERVGVFGAAGGSWLAARNLGWHDILEGSGVLLLPLHTKPDHAPFVVHGATDTWGPLLIAGQLVYPASGNYYSAEISAGGFLHLYGASNRCADPTDPKSFDISVPITHHPYQGSLWLPLVWDEVETECP